jgi:large subunit ribosomal protein L9
VRHLTIQDHSEESIKFKVKTGAQDRVFGSISPKQIETELKNKKYSIDKKQIKISSPLSSLGFHNVDIELHKKVVATIKV